MCVNLITIYESSPLSLSFPLRSIKVQDDKFRYDELIIACVVVALCFDYKSVLIAVAFCTHQYFHRNSIPFMKNEVKNIWNICEIKMHLMAPTVNIIRAFNANCKNSSAFHKLQMGFLLNTHATQLNASENIHSHWKKI